MYYDLIASLPCLPHFERADHLPITELRLTQRLRLLNPTDAAELAKAKLLVGWLPDRLLDNDAVLITEYRSALAAALHPKLRDYLEFRMEQKTLLAALRRKLAGQSPPNLIEPWGVGPRVRNIGQYWDDVDFGLAHIHAWLPKAREFLESGDARGLERLLMEETWRWLGHCAESHPFKFSAVFAYFFKWDILRTRIAWNAEKSRARFEQLVNQVTHADRN